MKKNEKLPDDILAMSFEKALEELESIVNQLEEGEVALEKSIAIYQRGNQLRLHCDNKLKEAKVEIEKITPNDAGDITREPLDVDG